MQEQNELKKRLTNYKNKKASNMKAKKETKSRNSTPTQQVNQNILKDNNISQTLKTRNAITTQSKANQYIIKNKKKTSK